MEAKDAVLYFVKTFRWTFDSQMYCLSLLIDYITYFKDVIQYYYCQFSPVSA